MTEKDILKKIEDSAEDVMVPESLKPEEVVKNLKTSRHRWKEVTAAAAMVLLVGGLGAFTAIHSGLFPSEGQGERKTAFSEETGQNAVSGEEKSAVTEAGKQETSTQMAEAEEQDAEQNPEGEEKQNAGELYVVASGYDEVYTLVEKYGFQENVISDIKMESAGSSPLYSVSEDSLTKYAGDGIYSVSDYSGTNLQTEGVDESDIVKTDGSYLYVTDNDLLRIIDIRGDIPRKVGEIRFSEGTDDIRVKETYVDGDTLVLITEQYSIQLQSRNTTEGSSVEDMAYAMETTCFTKALTYDIRDRSNPVLVGEISQEGNYHTSRKIGTIVYLFTIQGLTRDPLSYSTGDESGIIPLVNGEMVSADSIYLPGGNVGWGIQGLVVSSVDLTAPSALVDSMVIVNSGADIYVSTDALYLYHYDSFAEDGMTEIAKFRLKDGKMNAVGAATAPGGIQDTFAINEYDGNLRVLTTDRGQDGVTENVLSIYKEDLKLAGRIDKIAEGEEIYAARYFGDTAYFVTYRNTDPLFAVDLSDITNPVIIGELEITGFSEYLHLWGADKILGIGYETNPDTGNWEGVKLVMFDSSDPTDLWVTDSYVIAEADSSPAMWNYKCVLAEECQSLIGFVAMEYTDSGVSNRYVLFSWEDGTFRQLLSEELDGNAEAYRGIYVGDTFYIVSPRGLTSYDRTKDYEQKASLVF